MSADRGIFAPPVDVGQAITGTLRPARFSVRFEKVEELRMSESWRMHALQKLINFTSSHQI
ncbi:hypothetical protein EJB05_22994 [Eragrostis curvula]|uniref:Uncharacterized protein n=1 Tax=Eragrostis curvula TaxID=38414 RepID=A0A5J9V543_9POAL|nr:hypothetical protein EJB05_22994 [Eragrostis curvula]